MSMRKRMAMLGSPSSDSSCFPMRLFSPDTWNIGGGEEGEKERRGSGVRGDIRWRGGVGG